MSTIIAGIELGHAVARSVGAHVTSGSAEVGVKGSGSYQAIPATQLTATG